MPDVAVLSRNRERSRRVGLTSAIARASMTRCRPFQARWSQMWAASKRARTRGVTTEIQPNATNLSSRGAACSLLKPAITQTGNAGVAHLPNLGCIRASSRQTLPKRACAQHLEAMLYQLQPRPAGIARWIRRANPPYLTKGSRRKPTFFRAPWLGERICLLVRPAPFV